MDDLFSEDIVEAELRPETIEELRKRTVGEYAEDENEILKIYSNTGKECCQMIEISTGNRLGIVEGDYNRCPLSSYKSKMKRDEKYINIHNHPSYTSHSIADLTILLTFDQINEVRVVSADRTYIASYEGHIAIEKEEVEKIGKQLVDELSLTYPYTRKSLYHRNLAISEIFGIIFKEELV
ncbi:hypothetical protein [Arcobacter arenosus]|uniref:Uncharacterized protein n=1 Tax=Arcobacter arenosus TaxID=2576037 RepID=A0A5R8XYD0_9BACT|nr:hypothetical protein [Arcobacter arenosus]TLP36226.1 hypothetical protein FDK22_13225 [Arcobacter arenosus]